MPGKQKKIETTMKLGPTKIIRPPLTEEEKLINDRRRQQEKRIWFLQQGYRGYSTWLPDDIREEVKAMVRRMINKYEDNKK